MRQNLAYWFLKVALRLCVRCGFHPSSLRGLCLDAIGDLTHGQRDSSPFDRADAADILSQDIPF